MLLCQPNMSSCREKQTSGNCNKILHFGKRRKGTISVGSGMQQTYHGSWESKDSLPWLWNEILGLPFLAFTPVFLKDLPHPLFSMATSGKGIGKDSPSMGGTSLKVQVSKDSFHFEQSKL